MPLPKIGRPMELGKMSSRKKCNCPMAPTLAAALTVDRDHRLDADLEFVADPDHAGIDGAGGHRAGAQRLLTGVCNDASTSGIR